MKGNSRDLGISGAAGKGSADRTSDRRAFNANFDEIVWTTDPNKRKVKHYEPLPFTNSDEA